jgi:hypothetical protein
MYSPVVSSSEMFQGDVFANFPFIDFSTSRFVALQDHHISDVTDIYRDGFRSVLAEVDPRSIMLLSQTCDAQRRDNLIACPIYKISDYIQINQPSAGNLASLRGNKFLYWFYLPEHFGEIDESFVDLQQFFYVPRSVLSSYMANRILSLSDLGRHRIAWSIATYFGRPL